MFIPPKDFALQFIKKEQLTVDSFAFYFDKSQIPFVFLPGQYIRMFLDLPTTDPRGNTRLFSICSAPEESEIMIVTRNIQSPFKQTLAALQSGTKVKFFGPVGQFTFEKEETRPRIYLAGGIGITPFRSMVVSAATNNLTIPMTLFVSYRMPENILFHNELASIPQDHAWFRLFETITHPEESQTLWTGMTGRINEVMITSNVQNYQQAIFYTSGSSEMVEGTVMLLQSMGIPKEQIRKEVFTGY